MEIDVSGTTKGRHFSEESWCVSDKKKNKPTYNVGVTR